MPPRIPLRASGLRQNQLCAFQPRAGISTTQPSAALRKIGNPAAEIIGLDSDAETRRPSASIDRIRQTLFRDGQDRVKSAVERKRKDTLESVRKKLVSEQYLRQMPRPWRPGDVYGPHDLSPEEMKKWRKTRKGPRHDVLDKLGVNPLDMYRNFTMISEYVTAFGRIKHIGETRLRPVNQRKMARAIRRAVGMGLHPSVHRHPMILIRNGLVQPQDALPVRKPKRIAPSTPSQ